MSPSRDFYFNIPASIGISRYSPFGNSPTRLYRTSSAYRQKPGYSRSGEQSSFPRRKSDFPDIPTPRRSTPFLSQEQLAVSRLRRSLPCRVPVFCRKRPFLSFFPYILHYSARFKQVFIVTKIDMGIEIGYSRKKHVCTLLPNRGHACNSRNYQVFSINYPKELHSWRTHVEAF